MKILLVNKFLYPKGGSETYIFKLGECLAKKGHRVEYFGMDDEKRTLGNSVDSYTSNMDFHKNSITDKLSYSIKTIYSKEARAKIRLVLDSFQPDVCHLNNFNYQLTPSIILEIVKWRKETGRKCKIIYTAHDFQLVCPNHMMMNSFTSEVCEKCLGGHYINCAKGRCIHGSLLKSAVGFSEAFIWNNVFNVYKNIDIVVSPSKFLAEKINTNKSLAGKISVIHNFTDKMDYSLSEKKDYVLYFGRYSREKGIKTLLKAVDELPEIRFVFAGSGELENEINSRVNIENKGFLSGKELVSVISGAALTVVPSEWYENCPFSVIESLMYSTPVLGADIGGIPELIKSGVNGELFESGNYADLKNIISGFMNGNRESYYENCKTTDFLTAKEYCEKLLELYA